MNNNIKAMSGSEIARELGITRQAVSLTLKRAVLKIYTKVIQDKLADNPFEAAIMMQEFFGITNDEDVKQFFELFPKKIQLEISKYARIETVR